MTKFKPGDKVVCLKDSYDGSFMGHPGEIFTVSRIDENDMRFTEMTLRDVSVDVKRFELTARIAGFKARDTVRCIAENSHGYIIDKVYEVIPGYIKNPSLPVYQWLYPDHPPVDSVFEIVSKEGLLDRTESDAISELKSLIRRANEGLKAEHTLLEKFTKEIQRRHSNLSSSGPDINRWFDLTHNPYNGYSVYREKPKPAFTPFYVGKKTCCGYDPITNQGSGHDGPCTTGECLVRLDPETYKSLETSTLYIGSEKFNAGDARTVLEALCKNKLARYDEFVATRDGIEHKIAMSKKLSWADADRILEALESLNTI